MIEDTVPKLFTDEMTSGPLPVMITRPRRHNKIKVLVAMFFGVLFGAAGNVCLSRGMKCVGNAGYECAHDAVLGAVTQPYIISGVVLLAAFLLLYLASLSWEDLSYVLPLTAGDYVLVTLLAFFFLHEHVDALRWTGAVLVAAGIALVARS
jgi:drug/metabolite transporter (DMT)-like permease